jgi:hypothetical protein
VAVQIVVIPVLIGLLFELLIVVPLRVPIDESPVFLLYQDWALGLVFLKIWTRLVSCLYGGVVSHLLGLRLVHCWQSFDGFLHVVCMIFIVA